MKKINKKYIKAGSGKKIIKQKVDPPTTQDSIDLYNNAKLVEDFYTKSGHYTPDTYLETKSPRIVSNYNSENEEALQRFTKNQFYAKNNKPATPPTKLGTIASLSKSDYRVDIDKNRYKQRELANSILNIDSPMQLFDRRITPQSYNNYAYKSQSKKDPLVGDEVSIFKYDPIAVKPVSMLTPSELKIRKEKYGIQGLNKDTPNTNVKTRKKSKIDKLPLAGLNELDGSYKDYMDYEKVPSLPPIITPEVSNKGNINREPTYGQSRIVNGEEDTPRTQQYKDGGKMKKKYKYGSKLRKAEDGNQVPFNLRQLPQNNNNSTQYTWMNQNPGLPINDLESGMNAQQLDPISRQKLQIPQSNLVGVTPDVIDQYNPQQQNNEKQRGNRGDFNAGSFSTPTFGDTVAGITQGLNALIPYTKPKDNQKKLIEAYNSFPNGTNTHATFKKGGIIKGPKRPKYTKAKDGTELNWDNWNQLHNYIQKNNPNYGTDVLNHGSFANKDIEQFNSQFPNQAIPLDQVSLYQQGAINNPEVIKPFGQSPVEGIPGQKTTGYNHRNYAQVWERNGKEIGRENYGTNQTLAMNKYREEFNPGRQQANSAQTINGSSNNTNTGSQAYFDNLWNNGKNAFKTPTDVVPSSTPNFSQGVSGDQMNPYAKKPRQQVKSQKANYYTGKANYSGDIRNMATGGYIPQGEDGLYVEGGQVTKIGSNDSTGNTVQFNGPSHADGGIDINYAGQPVEVEGGETGFIDRSGSFNVLGNLKIPGSDVKFKTAGKLIAKEERTNKKMEKRGTYLLNTNHPHIDYESLSFNTGKVLHDASLQKEKEIGDLKEGLAHIQNGILEEADRIGIEPKEVVKGVKAAYGMKVKATKGKKFGIESLYDEEGDVYSGSPRQKDYIAPLEPAPLVATYKDTKLEQSGPNLLPTYNADIHPEVRTDMPFLPDTGKHRTSYKNIRNKIGLGDILPEIASILDQQQPVTAQQFNPELIQPYKVSFDGQLNANESDFNALQKIHSDNPAALGALSAQKYDQNSKILGEEFRTNQGIQNQVINQNTATINQAKEFNIKLADEQTVRQAQAYENTRAGRQAATTSISDKLAKNRAENTQMKFYEDLYHYGYVPKEGFVHEGEDYKFQVNPVNIADVSPKSKGAKTKHYKRDSDGNVMEEDTLALGGSIGGGLRGNIATRGMATGNKKKKRKYVK